MDLTGSKLSFWHCSKRPSLRQRSPCGSPEVMEETNPENVAVAVAKGKRPKQREDKGLVEPTLVSGKRTATGFHYTSHGKGLPPRSCTDPGVMDAASYCSCISGLRGHRASRVRLLVLFALIKSPSCRAPETTTEVGLQSYFKKSNHKLVPRGLR